MYIIYIYIYLYIYIYISTLCAFIRKFQITIFFKETFFYLKPVIFRFVKKLS